MATFRSGLLIPDPGEVAGSARRKGRGLLPAGASPRRPIEGRILEMQSTAGNAAVDAFLREGSDDAPPIAVQRDPIDTAAPDAATGSVGGTGGSGGGVGEQAGRGGDAVLRYGARGDDVKQLQVRLNRVVKGGQRLADDGIFGRRTQAAVRRFQAAHPPLKVDGDAGPETMAELDRTSPWTAGDVDIANVNRIFAVGRDLYAAGDYARAYDEFTKAWEITGDWAVLWNRAQALRLAGGRREDAIRLYEEFLASNADADVQRSEARTHLEELRGPGRSGQGPLDTAMVNMLYRNGLEHYEQGRYLNAYDEFSKAFEIDGETEMLWNRAQALRLAGGRREETIRLYEQFLAAPNGPAENRTRAAELLVELRGPGRSADAAANKQAVAALYATGQAHFEAGEYPQAYDAFTKAHDVTGDPAMLYNRAQALRLIGGRRSEAIALLELFLAAGVLDEARTRALEILAELRGPGSAEASQAANGGPRSVGAPTGDRP